MNALFVFSVLMDSLCVCRIRTHSLLLRWLNSFFIRRSTPHRFHCFRSISANFKKIIKLYSFSSFNPCFSSRQPFSLIKTKQVLEPDFVTTCQQSQAATRYSLLTFAHLPVSPSHFLQLIGFFIVLLWVNFILPVGVSTCWVHSLTFLPALLTLSFFCSFLAMIFRTPSSCRPSFLWPQFATFFHKLCSNAVSFDHLLFVRFCCVPITIWMATACKCPSFKCVWYLLPIRHTRNGLQTAANLVSKCSVGHFAVILLFIFFFKWRSSPFVISCVLFPFTPSNFCACVNSVLVFGGYRPLFSRLFRFRRHSPSSVEPENLHLGFWSNCWCVCDPTVSLFLASRQFVSFVIQSLAWFVSLFFPHSSGSSSSFLLVLIPKGSIVVESIDCLARWFRRFRCLVGQSN